MRVWAVAAALAAPVAAGAGGWQAMTGDRTGRMLTGEAVIHTGEAPARQVFHESGRTLYDTGRPDWDTWRVAGDRDCSQWPAATQRDSHDMETDGAGGAAVEGRIAQ